MVSVFATQMRPPGASAASPSVNVPPMSTAMRSALPLSFFFGTNHQSPITNRAVRYFNAAHARRMRWQASVSSSIGEAMDMRK